MRHITDVIPLISQKMDKVKFKQKKNLPFKKKNLNSIFKSRQKNHIKEYFLLIIINH